MALLRLAWSHITWGVVMQSGLERGFRYFKVSPIKAFRDICHVHVDKVFATGRVIVERNLTCNYNYLIIKYKFIHYMVTSL